MINFAPFCSNTSSSLFGSSKAMPKEGPPQPIDIVIRIAEFSFLSLRKSLITSDALSVTVNINLSPFFDGLFTIIIFYNLSIIKALSIIFFCEAITS